jgi:hypothetical protein
VGTDARRLVFDGYPGHNVLGSDLRQAFIDEGFELYQDADTCKIRFFTADVFDISASPMAIPSDIPLSKVTSLSELQNKVTHMYAALLFHLFDEASQYEIALKLCTLLKRHSGAVIFGRHQGKERASLITDNYFKYCLSLDYVATSRLISSRPSNRDRFIHSPESWRDLWISVFAEVEGVEFAETRITVGAQLKDSFEHGKISGRMMHWSVSIL